jgi:hypothetical protein
MEIIYGCNATRVQNFPVHSLVNTHQRTELAWIINLKNSLGLSVILNTVTISPVIELFVGRRFERDPSTTIILLIASELCHQIFSWITVWSHIVTGRIKLLATYDHRLVSRCHFRDWTVRDTVIPVSDLLPWLRIAFQHSLHWKGNNNSVDWL